MTATLDNVSNDAEPFIDLEQPYVATVRIQGTSALLFHGWSNEAVKEKSDAKKGSAAKKSDNIESYVYRNPGGEICLPGRYLIGSIIDKKNGAAKYRQDPRSPRKSALDLFKAGVVAFTELAAIHSVANSIEATKVWDYVDSQRVVVQMNAITRMRPAFLAGWTAEVQLSVLTPEYINPAFLLDVLTMAGKLVGVGDFRPSFGRFAITHYEISSF